MLLLGLTETRTHNGLEAVFGKDFSKWETRAKTVLDLAWDFGTVFLVTSIIWSFTTSMKTHMKIKTEQKAGFMSLLAKCTLGLRAFIVSVTRICCLTAYFGPYLGLLSCLQHLKAEQMDMDKAVQKNLISGNSYWDNYTVNAIYKPGQARPDYSDYTGIYLHTAFTNFVAILAVYACIIYLLKRSLSSKFLGATWRSQLQHVLEGLNMPDTYRDWDEEDEEEATPEKFRMKRKFIIKENIVMIIIHFLFNMMFLVPVFVTGMNIKWRHELIEPQIGTFQKEKEAYHLAMLLVWLLPLVTTIATLADILLSLVYFMLLHPWRIILDTSLPQHLLRSRAVRRKKAIVHDTIQPATGPILPTPIISPM